MPQNIWICPECFDEDTGPMEFKTFEAYQEHMQKVHSSPQGPKKVVVEPLVAPQPQKKAVEVRKTEPIALAYRYQGVCPDCGASIETIEIEAEQPKQRYCVAWCPSCKVSKQQRRVPALTAHDHTSNQKSK